MHDQDNICLICHELVKNEFLPKKECSCKIVIHEDCYSKLKINCNFDCPICRIKINKKINDNSLFRKILSLPYPINIISWVVFSYSVTFGFLLPMVISKIFTENENYLFHKVIKTILVFGLYYGFIFNLLLQILKLIF